MATPSVYCSLLLCGLLVRWREQSAAELTCDLVERVGRGWARGLEGPSGRSAADDGAGTDESSRLAILAECRQAFWSMDEVRLLEGSLQRLPWESFSDGLSN